MERVMRVIIKIKETKEKELLESVSANGTADGRMVQDGNGCPCRGLCVACFCVVGATLAGFAPSVPSAEPKAACLPLRETDGHFLR